MNKLAVISDLHYDINELDLNFINALALYIKSLDANRLHIAGDISNNFLKDAPAILEEFNKVLPTTFNLGNHDLLNLQPISEIEWLDSSKFGNYLNFKTINLNENTVLLGINCWYDYQFSSLYTNKYDDYSNIKELKSQYWADKYINQLADDLTINDLILINAKRVLDTLKNKRVILSTHFVPKKEFLEYKDDNNGILWNDLNAFLGSKNFGDLLNDYQNNVTDVVFGHTHTRQDSKTINGIKYHCNPIGYRFEWLYTRDWLLEHNKPTTLNLSIHKNTSKDLNKTFVDNIEKIMNNAITLIYY